MPYDIQDFIDLSQRQKQSRPQRDTPQLNISHALTLIEQAAVAAEKLISDPKWNVYLQQLQAALDKTKDHQIFFQSILDDPSVGDPNVIGSARLNKLLCDERIHTLEAVISYPAQLIDYGESAKLELTEMGGELLAKNEKLDNQ